MQYLQICRRATSPGWPPIKVLVLACALALGARPAVAATADAEGAGVAGAPATGATAGVAAAGAGAAAAGVGAAAAVGKDSATELPEITVTARWGRERSKNIPFGLSVISGDELETRRLLNLEDSLRGTPGVDVNSSGDSNHANVRVRGTGSLNQVGMDDGSVVLNMDGVSMSARHVSLGTLDVERVEVLKGPQGTLFGRNSEAGAINVTTRRPTRQAEAYLRGEYGQGRQHLDEGAIGGPLTERLSGRFAARLSGSEHWVDSAQDGKPLSRPRELAYRGSLLWDIGGGTSALLISERQEVRRDVGLQILRPFGGSPVLDVEPGRFNNNKKNVSRHSLEIGHDLAGSRFTSITALTTSDHLGVKGYDRTIMQALYGYATEYLRQDSGDERVLSQELRWSSQPGAPVFWVAGVNLSRGDRSFDSRDFTTGNTQNRDYQNRSEALYGELTYPLGAALKLTGGLRHSWERKTYDGEYAQRQGTVRDARRLSDSYSTGRVALSYAATPATNLYGVLARGYKSGGFSDYTTQIADSEPYKAAVANTAEIGFKTESADRRYALTGAVYSNWVRDDHLLGFDNTTFATHAINVNTRSRGAELEGSWRIAGGLTVAGGLSLIDAKITRHATGVWGGDVNAGNRTPDVPRWSANLSVAYHRPLPDFAGLSAPSLNVRAGLRVVGKRSADPQNHFELARYRKLDLRIGVASGSGEVYVWGDNLLNDRYDLYGYYLAPNVLIGAPARGRALGVGLGYTY